MAKRRLRRDSIERAIDGMLADPDHGEEGGEITVHDRGCGEGQGKTCTCVPRVLTLPPALVGKMWWWMRKLTDVRWT